MNSKILDGKKLSINLLDEIKSKIDILNIEGKRLPALAVVLVGNNPASEIYVRNKKTACSKVGIKSVEYLMSDQASQIELLDLINKLNIDPTIDGILVQLPLPAHISSKIVIDAINPHKDVDGFHRYNMGSLALRDPNICPCTPHGIIYILDSINFKYHGKHIVIIGDSNIVGRPMALELLNRGSTLTICNSKTINLPQFTKIADVIIVAVGKPKFLQKALVGPQSIVIDVGINRLADNSICGDADFENMLDIVQYITPVPGGVGPMTIAMLMNNTLTCYNNHSTFIE
ncbi:MAG: bifunctional methylenetetrahydrofolate dehydrogenase/methenyltetrahydrofolate cyclohydrolase FolD [Proteobacteria bacterium]|nr:bifunctional methylenetetrahydrofolate dehydrogenase/methenyltetrahydrofolate cyclohydrolase FolD [Pseudomonadota bacterium]